MGKRSRSHSNGGGGAKAKAPAAPTKGTKAKKAKATTNKQAVVWVLGAYRRKIQKRTASYRPSTYSATGRILVARGVRIRFVTDSLLPKNLTRRSSYYPSMRVSEDCVCNFSCLGTKRQRMDSRMCKYARGSHDVNFQARSSDKFVVSLLLGRAIDTCACIVDDVRCPIC